MTTLTASSQPTSNASDARKSALALVLGALGSVLTMAVHPHGPVDAAQMAHLAFASAAAHSLAIVSFLLVLLGTLGLTRRLSANESPESPDRLASLAFVTFAFAGVALLLATSVSGFIVPNLFARMFRDVPANAATWQLVITAIFQFNQAFSAIYSVATCVAITLWSASSLSHRRPLLGRFTTLYGCILPPITILLIAVGHLRFNVHGMAVVVLVHTLWFLAAAANLRTSANPS
jgi:hypothetical protein